MFRARFLKVFLLGVALFASNARAASTKDVWAHHIRAWEARSVSDIVADYSDDSILILHNQTFKGKDEIANVFSQLFTIFENGSNVIDTPVLRDRLVYITWHFTPAGESEFFGTDTFVIEHGKILLQTIASPLYVAHPIIK